MVQGGPRQGCRLSTDLVLEIALDLHQQRAARHGRLFLRHQLNIALRRAPHRLRLRRSDRVLLVWMTWLSVPKIRFGNIGGEVHRELAVK